MSENNLQGWACFVRLQFAAGMVPSIPSAVQRAFLEHGWVVRRRVHGDSTALRFTAKGVMVTDLSAPEWSIDSMPVEA